MKKIQDIKKQLAESRLVKLEEKRKIFDTKSMKYSQYHRKPTMPSKLTSDRRAKEEIQHTKFLKDLGKILKESDDPKTEFINTIYEYIDEKNAPFSRQNFYTLLDIGPENTKEFIKEYFEGTIPQLDPLLDSFTNITTIFNT